MNFRDNIVFKNYDKDRIVINSVASKLTKEENDLRNEIIHFIVKEHKPFDIATVCCNDKKATIQRLQDKNALAIAEDHLIYSIYPISAHDTRHVVTLADGTSFHAMCAIDALGSTYTFHQDISIQSTCADCGKAIKISVVGGKIQEASSHEIRVLHTDLKSCNTWSCCCCNKMHFFCSQADYDTWTKANNVCPDSTFCLDLNEALLVGRMLFSDNE